MTDYIKDITIDDLVKQVVTMQASLEDIEAGVRVIKDELRDRLIKMKITGTKVGDYFVSRVKRLNTSEVSIADARELGVTSTKETINMELLKKLYAKGSRIKGVKIVEFIVIKEQKS